MFLRLYKSIFQLQKLSSSSSSASSKCSLPYDRSIASSNIWLHRLTYFPFPYIISSVTCFRRQFPCNLWSMQLALLCFIICSMFPSSLTHCNTSSLFTQLIQEMQRLCSMVWDWKMVMNVEKGRIWKEEVLDSVKLLLKNVPDGTIDNWKPSVVI